MFIYKSRFLYIDIHIDLLNEIDYNEIERLKEDDLRWLLYIFVCGDESLREKVYGEREMMKKLNQKIDDYETVLDRWLYYSKEEIDNAGFEELGRKKMAKETAKKMLEDHLDIDLITKYTGLTLNQIENIKNEEN